VHCDPPFEIFVDPDYCSLETRTDSVSPHEDEFFEDKKSESKSEILTENSATENTMTKGEAEVPLTSTPELGPPPDIVSETGPRDAATVGEVSLRSRVHTVPSDRVLRPREAIPRPRIHNNTTGHDIIRETV
jgi:hypothetical protein